MDTCLKQVKCKRFPDYTKKMKGLFNCTKYRCLLPCNSGLVFLCCILCVTVEVRISTKGTGRKQE